MGWATFWDIFSQTLLVTLDWAHTGKVFKQVGETMCWIKLSNI
jgi:hypothetical protein